MMKRGDYDKYFSAVFITFVLFSSIFSVSASSVSRSFSTQTPGTCSALDVILNVTVSEGDNFYIIDEIFPSGWQILNAGTGNTSHSGHIKWSVTESAANTTYQYTVNTTCTAIGQYNFSGEYGFDDTILYNISGLTGVDVTDYISPIITLLGNAVENVEYGAVYNDAGATASDNIDGNLTSSIVINNTVNTNVVGTYTITYDVSDGSGNNATRVTRTVNVIDTSFPTITLIGSANIDVEFGSTYTDAGATASDTVDGNLTSFLVINNTVNTSVVGVYTVTYDVQDFTGNNATRVTRTVNVVDTAIPVITLTGNAVETVEYGSTYTDAGATASDPVDGDLTSSIVNVSNVNTGVVGVYTVTYDVSDTNGNNATRVTRTVNVVDTVAPTIILLGSPNVNISFGSTYTDAGATASDPVDGDLTSSIVNVSNVNTEAVGTYTVTYDVSDTNGNNATQVTRSVSVDPLICLTTADTDTSYRISTGELLTHIGLWNTGSVSNVEILRTINYWNIGLGC